MSQDLVDVLQAEIDSCWARTGLGRSVKVQIARQDDGGPHVEIVSDRYEIVITERGSETRRFSGLSLSEAARWYLFDKASSHAQSREVKERQAPENAPSIPFGLKDDGYSRWNWMAPTIETMQRISPSYGEWARQNYSAVLRQAPLQGYEIRNARWPLLPQLE